MNIREPALIISAVLALIITVIIRFTLFTDDCNLLVMAVTFLIFLLLSYGAVRLFRYLLK